MSHYEADPSRVDAGKTVAGGKGGSGSPPTGPGTFTFGTSPSARSGDGGINRGGVTEERLREALLLLQCANLMPECDLADDIRHAAAEILKPYQTPR